METLDTSGEFNENERTIERERDREKREQMVLKGYKINEIERRAKA